MASPSKRYFARGFAADSRTERALREALAGREARIQRGRLSVALRTLAAETATSLVFVDLDGIAEPETAARELSGVCSYETVLIAIGSVDTAQYGRALLQNGITDYLVKPVTPAAIREAVASAVDEAPDLSYAGDIVAFAGSPGSGTSTLVASVARGVVDEGRTASVVDLDPVSGKLAALLEVEPRDGLSTLVTAPGPEGDEDTQPRIDPGRLDSGVDPATPGLSLIAYPADGPLPASPDAAALADLFRRLANRTHAVLVTGAADPETRLAVLREADARVLVFEPTLASIGAAVRLMAQLETGCSVTLIQCSTRMRRYALSPAHVRYALADRRPDAVIPFDPALHAASTGKAPGRPGKAYRKALDQAMARIGNDQAPDRR